MVIALLLALVQAQAPQLDGTIAPGEWDRAVHVTGTEGMEIFLQRTDSAVYLAVRGSGDGFPHLALVHGDTILLLHASAALGTAKYVRAGRSHGLRQPFTFRVRGRALDTATRRERDAFYQREGWVASTMHMGRPAETEFKVAAVLLPRGERLAVAYWSQQSGVLSWPASAHDAVMAERIVQGFLPDSASFIPDQWGVVEE
jgi:hypothetical protein